MKIEESKDDDDDDDDVEEEMDLASEDEEDHKEEEENKKSWKGCVFEEINSLENTSELFVVIDQNRDDDDTYR